MPYITFTPNNVFSKAMFDFDHFGLQNFLLTGPVRVSVSDGFSYLDHLLGLVRDANFTTGGYSNEVVWTATQKENIQNAFDLISKFANIQFLPIVDYDTSAGGNNSIVNPAHVGNLSDINITFMVHENPLHSGQSSGNFNLSSPGFGYMGAEGDVLINYFGSAFTDGKDFAEYTKIRQVLLHEILHSLGLSHPFAESGGPVKPDFGALLDVGFQDLGFDIRNGSDLDKEYFTIMSYDDDESDISYINAYTPMILDVIALQKEYGRGSGTTGYGDDHITAGTIGYRTYFDTGGIDTIDVSMYSSGAYLHMGTSIAGADFPVGVLMSLEDALEISESSSPSSLRWFYGTFENTTGSNGADLLIGTALSNIISGESGQDYIKGQSGDDSIEGGIGNDTIYGDEGADSLEGGSGDDSLIGGPGNDLFDWSADSREGKDTME